MRQLKVEAASRPNLWERKAAIGAILVACVVLAIHLQALFTSAVIAIRYPFGIDYGEGIVWQQALQIQARASYGSIAGFPAIVFHYPPVYHLLTIALARADGLDFLMAGRIVSFTATLGFGLLAGAIVYHVVRCDARPRAAAICSVIGSLVAVTSAPVTNWAPLMRVDMVATAFSLGGIWLAMRALTRPLLIHAAAVCFVAAVFTKQTAIAAPVATFLTLLALRPRVALAGMATSLGVGLAALAMLEWMTNGGFLRHILLYNINRFDLSRLSLVAMIVEFHGLYVAAACLGTALWVQRRSHKYRGANSVSEIRRRLQGSEGDIGLSILVAYFLLTTVMLVTVAKVGSNINYFIDWILAAGMLAAIGCCQAACVACDAGPHAAKPLSSAVLLPALIGIQAMLLPPAPDYADRTDPRRVAQLQRLTALVKAADRPVISDDMVVLLRAGQPVMWEPAIFAELSSKGMWDPAPFVAKIRRGEFAFFVTEGGRGDPSYEERYGQFLAIAIAEAYPVKRTLAGYTLHLPVKATANPAPNR